VCVLSASTLPDIAVGLFSSDRDKEGSEELVYYLHCWFLLHVNYLVLYVKKALVISQLNGTVTSRAFRVSVRNTKIEEVGGKIHQTGWRRYRSSFVKGLV